MSRKISWVVGIALGVVGWPGFLLGAERIAADPTPRIEQVRFEGNRRTRPATMLREMLVGPGDPVDPDRIERSRQAIMDLELFKSVRADLVPGTGGATLVITVEEKRYFFVLPALNRDGDGDWTFGAQARFENLWGLDHRLMVEAVRTNFSSDADVDHESNAELSYRYARILDGPWEVDSTLLFQNAFLEEERDGVLGNYERDTSSLRMLAARWKNPAGPSRGWRFGVGLSREEFEFRLIDGAPGLFFDTTEVGLLGHILYDDVHSYDVSRSGLQVGYNLQLFTEELDTARPRLVHSLRFRSYNRISERRHTNLNFQFRWQLTTKSLFGDPSFDLGGGTRLRGYDRQAIEGDALILANLEFLTPLSRRDALRCVAFLDVGDAFADAGHFTLADLEAAAGVGLRWKLRSFVRVDLRLDVARGFDDDRGGTTKVYAGTDATF